MNALIAVHGLTKGYGRSRGIIDVTFEIAEGEEFGFLGPNGTLRAKSSQGLAPRLYGLASAFVCTDKACSWESREAWGLHFLRFQMFETSVRDYGSQILHAAPPGVKSRSPAALRYRHPRLGTHQSAGGRF